MLTLAVSGCVTVSQTAICDGTNGLRNDHADALLEDGGERSILTGAALIMAIDKGCGG